jgi:prepilin-type N-terminal cleavage/methylation domain-containing protein/prepilin-type processing-associated H-X9-DG protein
MRKGRGIGWGFTLLELLVVVAISGILSAFLVSTLSKARGQSRSATCKHRLRQLGMALQLYVADHNQRYPYGNNPDAPEFDSAVGPTNTRYWWAKLLSYDPLNWLSNNYHCPGYKGAINGESDAWPPFGSYAYNAYGVRSPQGEYTVPGQNTRIPLPRENVGLGPPHFRLRLPNDWTASEAEIAAPSQMSAIGESRFLSTKANNGNPGGRSEFGCGLAPHQPNEWAVGEIRHGKNYNQLFCDGHISAMDPWILFNPTNSARLWNYDHSPHPELWSPW